MTKEKYALIGRESIREKKCGAGPPGRREASSPMKSYPSPDRLNDEDG